MRRRCFRKQVTGVSLFPFLAVLICTVGALIVLLVMVVQQARVDATAVSQQQSQAHRAPRADEQALRQQREDYQWRREILEQQRTELTEQLAGRRLELSHLEDHIRRLQDQAKQLAAEADDLERSSRIGDRDLGAARAELERLKSAVHAAKEQLDEAQQKAANRPRSFTLIAYKGPQGTRRRPVYIECVGDGVILRPEGVVLQPNDLTGPLGPGNPLDAALRATREYWARHRGAGQQGEPYPLLIVRPDGAAAFALARAAMKSWDDEFGYELIDDGMELEFPPADPALVELLQRTIYDARRRQAILAAAMPSRFKDEEGLALRATRRGGFAPYGESAEQGGGFGPAGGGFKPPGGGYGAGRDRPADGQTPDRRAQSGKDGEDGDDAEPMGGGGGTEGGEEQDETNAGAGARGSAKESLARTKGFNWGLPNTAANATGITRPIRVVCLPDQLVILPDRGDQRPPRVIAVPGATRVAIEEFVSAIWKHMERWGIAVAGGYWKPVLQVEVAAGGERRFTELQALLQGSGIDVERKSP